MTSLRNLPRIIRRLTRVGRGAAYVQSAVRVAYCLRNHRSYALPTIVKPSWAALTLPMNTTATAFRSWRDFGMRIDGPVVVSRSDVNRMFIGAHADSRAVIAFTRGLATQPVQYDSPALLTLGPGFNSEQLRQALHRDIRTAKRIAIVAAYFTPPWRLRRAMRKASRRGIIRVILPGLSDVPPMRYAAHHLYERMLRHRIEIFGYQPQILHSKLW